MMKTCKKKPAFAFNRGAMLKSAAVSSISLASASVKSLEKQSLDMPMARCRAAPLMQKP